MEMCKYTSRNIGFIHLGILTLYDKCRLIATKVRLKNRPPRSQISESVAVRIVL